jgi:large subunit ribosomal protein L24
MSVKKCSIKKNDMVQVISGKEKGRRGKVLRINLEKEHVLVENINFIKRSLRPSSAHRQGGIVEKEGPIPLSNVMLVCPKCSEPVRVSKKVLEDGTKVRYCRKCDEILDK